LGYVPGDEGILEEEADRVRELLELKIYQYASSEYESAGE
jgi:hypothetical protein